MIASAHAELLKLVKRPAIWIIVAVWMTLSLIFGYIFPYFSYRGSPAGPGAGESLGNAVLSEALPSALVPAAIQGFPLFAGALALLIGVLATGSEYEWDTVKVLLTQGPARWSVLGGKILTLIGAMLLIVMATFVIDGAASAVVASLTANSFNWPPVDEVLTGVGAGWLIVSMWCMAGAFLGLLFRGAALAIGIGLVWMLAVENLLRIFGSIVSAVDAVQQRLPGTNAGALVAALGVPVQGQPGGTPGVTAAASGNAAAAILAVYLVVFITAATVLIVRRDVV